MRVKGVVSKVEDGYAWVDVSVAQGCGRCNEPGGCGGVNIARPLAQTSHVVRVSNDIGALPGDPVGVLVEDGLPLKAALATYAWPVVGVLAGAALGSAVAAPGGADLLAALGAVAGGTVAALLGRRRIAWSGAGVPPLRIEKADLDAGGCGR